MLFRTTLSVLLLSAPGCGEPSTPSAAPPVDEIEPDEPEPTPEAPSLPDGVSPAAIRIACNGVCTSGFSRVEVWRDEDGAVARLIVPGAPQPCSHGPTLIYDAAGRELGASANIPWDPENPSSVASRQTYEENTRTFTRVERVSCAPFVD